MKTVSFSEVAIGCMFFDPECGETFIKTSDTHAEVRSGSVFDSDSDSFAPDEQVEVE